ncbi:MAG: adenylate kinase [bacterium]
MKNNLVFLGPPGSGKGTQAVKLAEKLTVAHVSTGDVLRNAVKEGTPLGKEAETYMKKGELVPDHLLVGLIETMITDGKLKDGFILDGFPRTVPQAESLKEMFGRNQVPLQAAVLFQVSDSEVIRRLSGRWFCPQCQATYNYPARVPEKEGVCDQDGAALQRRPDDEEAVVRNRLEVYRKQTRPIEDFYRRESVLAEIKAEGSPDEVFEALVREVG